jgi:selenocysteine-specific elongation factor
MTLAEPGRFHPTKTLDCRLTLLPGTPPLRRRSPLRFHTGTADVMAEARLLESGFARIALKEPVLLLPGDRFILRRPSPATTIGGGVVLDILPPRKPSVERLRILADAPPSEHLLLFAGDGVSMDDLIARTGLLASEIETTGFVSIQRYLVPRQRFDALVEHARTTLCAFHAANPLRPGMRREDLRSDTGMPTPVFDALLAAAPDIVGEGETVRLASHRVQLGDDEQTALAAIESAFARAGLAVPATAGVLASCGVEPARARTLLQMLLRQRKLVTIGKDLLYHSTAIDRLKRDLTARKGQTFSVPDFKDWTGVSRRHAIPLLEYLDRERITRRQGDQRLVL